MDDLCRWRALGLAADLRCPLHQGHPAGPRAGLPLPSRRSQLLPRLPLLSPICAGSLASTPPRSVLAAAAPPLAPLASLLATSAATPLASTTATSAAASAATAAAAHAALPPFVAVIVALLPSIGTFLLCLAASVLLLAAVPTVQAMGRAAARAERVLAVAEEQLPDTLAAMRLSGLEVTDCIQVGLQGKSGWPTEGRPPGCRHGVLCSTGDKAYVGRLCAFLVGSIVFMSLYQSLMHSCKELSET